jgi:hypothetical protein
MVFIPHISQSTTMWLREKLWINSRLYSINSKIIWWNIILIFKRIFKYYLYLWFMIFQN